VSFEFKLPDIGEGIAEGEVTRWHVKEGDTVREDDPFVEVMTDKATVEIPAPKAGVIESLKVAEGQTVPVGEVLCVIGGSGGAAAPKPEAQAQAVAEVAAPVAAATAAAGNPAAVSPTPLPTPRVDHVATPPGRRVLAAPAVRRRARENGIDLKTVPGTGPAGRVTRDDLARFLATTDSVTPPLEVAAPAATPTPSAPVPLPIHEAEREVRVPLRGIRKRIAARMAQSKQTAAHFTYVDEVDVTELVEMRQSLKETAAQQGVKLTYMPFIVKATVEGLRKFPMLNSSLDEATQEIVYKNYYHIGFAADTENGLVVPVVKDADRLSLVGLAGAIQNLAARAREGKLAVEEVSGSTFTITNAGNIGGILATPVINYPEVAILGVHKIAERAVVKSGEIVIRKMMNLSISLDHRLVDGADGARFMNHVIAMLEDPKLLLLGTL
jgi:pyruvate dehydrogenase E2 component (dihydrolipoamide acetyltransferase)